MKKSYVVLALSLLLGFSASAVDTWTAKASFSGAIRHWAVGFSIGSKGYIGTGYGGGVYRQDIWEYDPALDVWTQKADFGGGLRLRATAFSIGSKGYICAGLTNTGTQKKDLWEYDPTLNTWIPKADFGGVARELAAAFVIGTKAYMGTGYAGTTYKVDMWEYDQGTNVWTAKANHPHSLGTAGTVAFSIGSIGYMGTGYNGSSAGGYVYFFAYNPATNTWSSKANISGGGFREAVGFAIGGKGYIGIGRTGSVYSPNFYEYDPVSDGWTPKTAFIGGGRYQAVGFAIGSVGYVGTGIDAAAEYNDFYEWKNCSAAPSTPGTISGTNNTCPGVTNNYSVPAVAGATSYTWTLPGDWTGSSSTNSISAVSGLPGTVTIYVTANNPCGVSAQQSLSVTVNTCTGISESEEANGIQVYPNPAAGQVSIMLPASVTDGIVSIHDLKGQKVHEERMTCGMKKSIDLSRFAKGAYTVSLLSDGKIMKKKLIVQ